jgi:hypothetical protein
LAELTLAGPFRLGHAAVLTACGGSRLAVLVVAADYGGALTPAMVGLDMVVTNAMSQPA